MSFILMPNHEKTSVFYVFARKVLKFWKLICRLNPFLFLFCFNFLSLFYYYFCIDVWNKSKTKKVVHTEQLFLLPNILYCYNFTVLFLFRSAKIFFSWPFNLFFNGMYRFSENLLRITMLLPLHVLPQLNTLEVLAR